MANPRQDEREEERKKLQEALQRVRKLAAEILREAEEIGQQAKPPDKRDE